MNAPGYMPKKLRFFLLAAGIGFWLLLPGVSFAQMAPVVQFTFSGSHSAGAVTGTFTLDRVNGVLLDFDIVTPFFHYIPSNTFFVAVDDPSGFTVSLAASPVSNPPQYLNLSFAGSVETFTGGTTIPRVDILVNGQLNIAYFLTQEQFQGNDYILSGSAQITTDQMTTFGYGVALACLSRSVVTGVCDEGSFKNAQVTNGGSASMSTTYLGPTSSPAQLVFSAFGESSYGALNASATASFNIANPAAIAYSAGVGESRDIWTVSSPPFNGTPGFQQVQLTLLGNISRMNSEAFAEVLVDIFGPHFSNLQEASAFFSCPSPGQTCFVNNTFTVTKSFSFIYGQPFAFQLALIAQSGTTSPSPSGRGYLWTESNGQGSGTSIFANTLVLTGLEFFDSNGNPLPSAPTITSASGTHYSVDGVLLPFAEFSAELELGRNQNFEVNESFTLAATSNGINPPSEDVGFQIGTFSCVIPRGSFQSDSEGRYRFEGVLNGVSLEAVIKPLANGKYQFQAEGHGANLAGVVSPVKVKLMIGDDGGTAIARLDD